MHRVVALVAWLSLGSVVFAQSDKPQVDRDSVLRMGNSVQIIDGTYRSDNDFLFGQVMGPPPDDNGKWFISVVAKRDDAASLKLKADWSSSPDLMALARPNLNEQKESWSHFNWYLSDDKSQSFRFEKLQIANHPTVLVQPPRNGQYGDPKTIVYQGVYQGDPKKQADAIRNSIRRYLTKFPVPAPTPVKDAGVIGLDPPWNPPSKADPNIDLSRAFVLPKAPDTLIPPPDQPSPVTPSFKLDWGWLFKNILVPILAALFGLMIGRKMQTPASEKEESALVPEKESYPSAASLLLNALSQWEEEKRLQTELIKAKEAEEQQLREALAKLVK